MKTQLLDIHTGKRYFVNRDDYIRPNFKVREIISHKKGDEDRVNLFNSKLLDIMQLVRNKLGEALYISCVYRSPVHNREVGGVDNSVHLTGSAVDCYASNLSYEELKAVFERVCREIGVRHYYIYNINDDGKSVHFDIRVRW